MLPYPTLHRAYCARDASIQAAIGASADGVWGPDTDAAALAALESAWQDVCASRVWVYRRVGRQVPRRDAVHTAIWHWPGGTDTADTLGDRWKRNDLRSGVSSHCGIDERGVVWYAAPHMRTNHARGHNTHTIGIDICVPILERDRAAAEMRGVFVGVRDYVSGIAPNGGRHRHRALDLDSHVAARCGALRRGLDDALWALAWVDHHRVDPNNKWDCGPWEHTLLMHGAIDRR
jgi:hypothetical protein